MKKFLLTLTLVTLIVFTAKAQWQNVGTAGFTPGGADSPSLAFNSTNEPYVVFKDGANGLKATVMKFDGTNWVMVGNAGFSTSFAGFTSLAFNSIDEPHVAYRDDANSEKVTVMKYDGTNWVTVGNAGFSGQSQADFISLAFNSNDEPYVAYRDLTVIDNTVNKATVMKFDGTNWVTVGVAGFSTSSATNISLALNSNDEPFVAYRDGALSNKATVMKYDGTDWVTVGTAGFSVSNSEFTSIAINSSDEPYVAFRDDANADKVSVMKFDGTDWVTVGTAGFSEGVASYTSLAFNSSDEPYVAFREFVSGSVQNQATVMKFDGTNWVMVGAQGFSAGYVDQTSLVINNNDELFISFVDVSQAYKATVMKYVDGTTSVASNLGNNNSIKVYPNPTSHKFSFTTNTETRWELFDLNGRLINSGKSIIGENSIEIEGNSGVYYLKINKTTKKIIKI